MALSLEVHSSRTLKRQQCIAVWAGSSEKEDNIERSEVFFGHLGSSDYKVPLAKARDRNQIPCASASMANLMVFQKI